MMTEEQFRRHLADIEQGSERQALEALEAFIRDIGALPVLLPATATVVRIRARVLGGAMLAFWDRVE